MLLAVDIGNSAIKFGLFNGDKLTSKFSIPTKRDAPVAEIESAIAGRLDVAIGSALVCSVVPVIEPAIGSVLSRRGIETIFVRNSFDFGLKINYEPLESLGTDRLVNAFAAVEKYGAPCIVCSFGTATTIDAVSADREFLGGVIAPGVDAMAEALHLKAAKLPLIEIREPDVLLGNTTEDAIRSGVYNGYVAMVEGLIERFRGAVGPDAEIVATGGNAGLVPNALVDSDLILKGLNALAGRFNT